MGWTGDEVEVTYADALFDQVVFVAFELGFKPVGLELDFVVCSGFPICLVFKSRVVGYKVL